MYGISVLFCRVVRNTNYVRYKGDSSKRLLEFLANMPKSNTGRIAESQKQRQLIAKKGEKYGASSIYLQVLGSGARGAPNTLYLFTDQKRYMFNCGECTQRLAHEHKVKLSRLDHIFITSKTWRNIGGLPGLSLTLQDVGVPSITLHGPDGLDELYSATRRFVTMKEMNVAMAKCSPSEDFEDNVMNVKYVILGPNEEILDRVKDIKPSPKRQKVADSVEKEMEEFMHDDTDYYRPEVRNFEGHTKRFAKDRVKTKVAHTSSVDPIKKKTDKVLHDLQKKTNCTVSYICTLKKRPGTLDLAKCVELGVKPGPLLGQLKNGHDVVLPDGTLVFSKDVKTPDDPGPVFMVLDVPDISYLREGDFSSHFANGVNPQENIPTLVVHYTPPEVFHNVAYQAFLTLFGPTTRHLILNGQNSCLGSEAVHRTQHKLHLLDPDIFPLLKDVSVPAVWNAHPPVPKTNSPIRLKGLEELKNKIALAQFQNIINMESSHKSERRPPSDEPQGEQIELIAGRTLTVFHLRPRKQLDRSSEPKLHIQDYIQETMDVDGFVGSLEQFRRLVDSMRYSRRGAQKEFPKVVFLGTGSCIPSKTRNTSAIVVHVDENRSVLLDCGEGTFGQLVRFYGPKRVNSFLRTLRAIYISHLHADHHIGLIGVLQARRQAYDEVSSEVPAAPVYLLAPGQIVSWLQIYDLHFERIKPEYTLVPNQSLLIESTSTENKSAMLASLGLRAVETVHVPHCPNAFGVALSVDRHKITYSGDTLPCEALVKLGHGSTLLIHEATMEDELAEEARIKMHSTTTQAIEIGRAMNAKYTVLTHFSQRYARLPRLNANILNDNNSVGIAFDNMQITMADLDLLPHMYAPLQLMFAEHCVEMELKAANRARQKLRSEARRSEPDLAEGNNRQAANCRGTSSMPIPRGFYRDSNSSKLRAESKGMVLQNPQGCKSPRSKSQSPCSRSNNGHATPKSGNSGRSTPARSRSRGGHSSDAPPEHPNSLGTPARTLSLTSSCVSSATHIVDTRSKTLNTVNKRAESATTSKKRPLNTDSGYGRPLVTPMDKRLTLRRDLNVTSCAKSVASEKMSPYIRPKSPLRIESVMNDKIPPYFRSKSPSMRAADNRRCHSSIVDDQRNISKTKIPTKRNGSGSKLRASNRDSLKDGPDVSPPRSPASVRGITSGRFNNLTSPHPKLFDSPQCKTIVPARVKSASPPFTSTSSTLDRGKNDPSPIRKSGIKPPMIHSSKTPITNSETIDTKDTSKLTKDTGRTTKSTKELSKPVVEKRSLTYLKDTLKNTKKTHDKIKPIAVVGRPNSAIHSNKSFKPQLEDIKSSFILLSKKQSQHRKDNVKNSNVKKPKILSDEERRQKIMEIRNAFKSKQFWSDAKYDKIEGLNWISWK